MKEKIKIILSLILAGFFLAEGVFAMDIPVFSLIVSENSSGYICSGNSIGCSSLNSIYKIEKRGNDTYICSGNSIGDCSSLDTLYKTNKYNQNTIYICSSNSFGSCSTFNVLYKISKHDESTNYVCSGNSIGDCSIFNVLYKISKHDKDTTFACPGDSIGDCSIFNVLYKFKKIDTQSSGYSGIDYNNQIKAEQEKNSQLEEEERKITENYLNALNDLNIQTQNFLQYTCPVNSTLIGSQCSCNGGYVASGNSCITYTQNCQNQYGINSYSDGGYCYCSTGYEFNTDKTACIKNIICPSGSTQIDNSCVCPYIMRNNECITYSEDCRRQFGPNVFGLEGNDGDSSCYCNGGYEWNTSQTACIKIQEKPSLSQEKNELSEKQLDSKLESIPEIEKNEIEEKLIIDLESDSSIETENNNNQQRKSTHNPVSRFLGSIYNAVKSIFIKLF